MINPYDIFLLVLGAGISLISSLTIFVAQSIYNKKIDTIGNVKIYKKLVYNKSSQKPWGFYAGTFSIPLWLELQNTKNQNEVVRNINLTLYYKNKEVALMTQINHVTIRGEVNQLANDGSYSIILKPNSIEKLDLLFSLRKAKNNSNFDEVRLRYYDTKDKKVEYTLLKIREPWSEKNNYTDEDWKLME